MSERLIERTQKQVFLMGLILISYKLFGFEWAILYLLVDIVVELSFIQQRGASNDQSKVQ